MKYLVPDLSVEQLADIDIGYWHDRGIRCVFIDLDNTISHWRQTSITDDAMALIDKARDAGLTVVIFTNASEDRAREAAWNAGIGYYASARKPLPKRYRRAIAELDYENREIMAIGDQIFTDVLGGNLTGCTTVLISPLSEVEHSGTKLFRLLEKLITGREITFKDRLYPYPYEEEQPAEQTFDRGA
ncbi:MAG: YqeG family HAD IIIA-type phosphatase [Clostridiales bacterium]|nr:YqeG family HAD IIIA-type phosphatase [Clostridiales bacterium]